jgi:hypothetical protein
VTGDSGLSVAVGVVALPAARLLNRCLMYEAVVAAVDCLSSREMAVRRCFRIVAV